MVEKMFPYGMFALSATLFLAAFLLEKHIPGQFCTALYAAGGMLLGFGVVGFVSSGRRLTPEEKKDMERAETDERNMAIREKAALSTWYWTMYMLWAAFLLIQIFVGGLWGVVVSAAIVLHCVFYMINVHRWSKKM